MTGEPVGVVGVSSGPPRVYHTRACHSFERVEETRVVYAGEVDERSLTECQKCKYDWELAELDLGEWE